MANRKNTFLIKRSSTPGKVPTSGDLLLGELALNTADVILYASGTTSNSILPIGWDRVARTGDTMTGTLYTPSLSATTISATTYFGLPTIATISAITNNNNIITLTNSTGGTYSTLFNTVTGLTINGNLSVTGNTTMNGTLNVTGQTTTRGIVPEVDNTYVLGSTTRTWSNFHTREIRLYDSSGNDAVSITVPSAIATSPDPAWSIVLPLVSGATFTMLGVVSGASNTSNTGWFNISAGTNVSINSSSNTSGGTITISSIDTTITGGTYSAGTTTFTNNTGGTFSVSGFVSADTFVTGFTYLNNVFTLSNSTGGTLTSLFNTVTGLTVNGNLTVTGNTVLNSLSATTYLNLPTDIRVTGGTLSAGTAIFTNNTGGTFSVSGFSTGGTGTDTYVTGVTVSNGILSVKQNQGQPTLTASTNNTRELTFNSNDMALNTATRAVLTPLVMSITRFDGTGVVDDAGISFVIPSDYIGNPQFYFTWRAASTAATTAKIYLDLYTGSTNNLGSLITSVETLGIITTPAQTNTFIFSSAATSTTVFSGGNTVHARIYRDPGDANDTFTGALDMININFKYNSIS